MRLILALPALLLADGARRGVGDRFGLAPRRAVGPWRGREAARPPGLLDRRRVPRLVRRASSPGRCRAGFGNAGAYDGRLPGADATRISSSSPSGIRTPIRTAMLASGRSPAGARRAAGRRPGRPAPVARDRPLPAAARDPAPRVACPLARSLAILVGDRAVVRDALHRAGPPRRCTAFLNAVCPPTCSTSTPSPPWRRTRSPASRARRARYPLDLDTSGAGKAEPLEDRLPSASSLSPPWIVSSALGGALLDLRRAHGVVRTRSRPGSAPWGLRNLAALRSGTRLRRTRISFLLTDSLSPCKPARGSGRASRRGSARSRCLGLFLVFCALLRLRDARGLHRGTGRLP